MIAHYFGNKSAMVDALVQRIMIDYISRLQKKLGNAAGDLRIQRLLDFIFGPGVLGDTARRKVLIQLLAEAPQDEKLRVQIQFMYESFIEIGTRELQKAFPDIAAEKLTECAYGILCLTIGNDTVLLTALPYTSRKSARQCAEIILSGLTA